MSPCAPFGYSIGYRGFSSSQGYIYLTLSQSPQIWLPREPTAKHEMKERYTSLRYDDTVTQPKPFVWTGNPFTEIF